MEAQFQIPLSRNDLLSSNGEYYVVKEVYSVREIGPKLEGIHFGLLVSHYGYSNG